MKKPIKSRTPLLDISAAIGSAITNWQNVEFQLSRVLLSLITTDEKHRAASAAFNSVLGFRDRLAMTDSAVKIALDEHLAGEWRTISDRIGERSKKRNALAHYTLVQEHDDGAPLDEFYYTLQPNVFDAGRHQRHRHGIPKLTVSDIQQQGLAFNTLAERIGEFADRIVEMNMPARAAREKSVARSSSVT